MGLSNFHHFLMKTSLGIKWNSYLESARANKIKFLMLADEPRTHTIWPYSCIIDNICSVVSDVQSVNSDTSNGTLSTCSKWGFIFIIPQGNFACKSEKFNQQFLTKKKKAGAGELTQIPLMYKYFSCDKLIVDSFNWSVLLLSLHQHRGQNCIVYK